MISVSEEKRRKKAEDSPVVDDEGDANQVVAGMVHIYRF